LLIFQVSRGDLNLIEVSEAEGAALKEQAARIASDALTRIMEVLTDCEGRLRDTTSKKILIEVTLLKMIEARHALSIDAVLKQVQLLRTEAGVGAPVAAAPRQPAPAPQPPAKAAPVRAAAEPVVAATSAGETELEQLWVRLVEAVGRASPFVRTYFTEAHPVSLAKNVLTIGFDEEFAAHIPLVDNSKNHTLIQTKLAELGHPHVQVKFIKAEAPPNRKSAPAATPASAPAPAPVPAKTAAAEPAKTEPVSFDKDNFKNDPLIQKALEVFKGQIVDVRS
jgi:DNA polymerase-3 subunit gamma/tau